MGIFKKSLAIVLAALMLLSICTVVAFAEGEATSTVVRGDIPGCAWDNTKDTENAMTASGSTFTKTFSDIPAGSYNFKVFEVGKGDEGWHGRGQDNVKIEVSDTSDLTITFDPATADITLSGTNVKEMKTVLEIENMFAVGDGDGAWLNGVAWDPGAESNKMTGKDGVYTITYNAVAADKYQVKFVANGDKTKWDIQWGTEKDAPEGKLVKGSNPDSIVFEVASTTGYADVTLTFDATKLNKEDGTGATYKIDTVECAAPTEAPTTEEATTEAATTEADTTATEATEADTTATEATEADTTATEATEADTTATEAATTATEATEADTTATEATEADTTATEAATEAETTADKPIVPGFYVVGSEEACGAEWGWEKPYNYNDPMKQASDGTYFQVVENVKASKGNVTDEGPDIFVFKVVYVNEQGGITWHPGGMGNNTMVTVAEDGSTLLFQFKLLASKPTKEGTDPEAVKVTVYGPKDEKPAFDDPKYPEEETTAATEEATTVATEATQPATEAPVVTKDKNPVKVKVTAKKVTVKKLKNAKKTFTVATIKIAKAQGKVTIAKVKKGTTSKIYKKVTVTKKSITLKKGTYKKGTYKVKIKVTAAGNTKYKKGIVTKTVSFRVK